MHPEDNSQIRQLAHLLRRPSTSRSGGALAQIIGYGPLAKIISYDHLDKLVSSGVWNESRSKISVGQSYIYPRARGEFTGPLVAILPYDESSASRARGEFTFQVPCEGT